MPLQGRDWEWRQNLEALMLLAMSDWNEKGSQRLCIKSQADSHSAWYSRKEEVKGKGIS